MSREGRGAPPPTRDTHDPEETASWGREPSRREAGATGLALGVTSALIEVAALTRRARGAAAEGAATPAGAPGQGGAHVESSGAGAAAYRPRFLTAREYATLDALAETILPADAHSPGARAAGVAADLDGWLARLLPRIPEQRATRAGWKRGLAEVERLARARHRKPFVSLSPGEQHALVGAELASNEGAPTRPGEKFFAQLKPAVVRSYYTSEIGIHRDIRYPGNTYLDDYPGLDPDGPLTLPPPDDPG